MGWRRGRPFQNGPDGVANTHSGNLPITAIIPGLIVVVFYDLYGFLYPENPHGFASIAYSTLLLILPWITIILLGRGIGDIGVSRQAVLMNIGWGILAGVIWRVSSILLNFTLLQLSGFEPSGWAWLQAIAFVPWAEEIFFRGYLGLALAGRFGGMRGNFLQASLFTLQPSHVVQGFPGLISIFFFGMGAGWLVRRRRSVWIGVAAHAGANALLWTLAEFV